MNMKTDKQKSIYLAAAKLFAQNGFEGTSMDDIAKKANVAKGTIFYHFKNKEELFSALIEEGVGILSSDIEKIYKKSGDVKDKISQIIDYHFIFFKKHRDLCLIILGQIGNFQKQWNASMDLIREKYLTSMEKIIKQAKDDGVISKDLETEGLVVILFSLLAVSGVDWAIFHEKIPQQKMTSTIKTLLFNGFIKT